MYLVTGNDIAQRTLVFGLEVGKINIKLQSFELRLRLKGHFHNLCLAVGIG